MAGGCGARGLARSRVLRGMQRGLLRALGNTWGGCLLPGTSWVLSSRPWLGKTPRGAGLASPQWEGTLRILPRVPSHRVTKLAGCRRPRWLPGDGLHEDGRARNCQVTWWLLEAGTRRSARRDHLVAALQFIVSSGDRSAPGRSVGPACTLSFHIVLQSIAGPTAPE